jgi:hypothetical protein
MVYDDIRKGLANWTAFLRILKKDISSNQIRNYPNVLNALIRLGEIIRTLEKKLDKQDDKNIRRRCDHIKDSAAKLQDIVSDSIDKPVSWIKVTGRLESFIAELNDLSELLAETSQSQPEGDEKDRQSKGGKELDTQKGNDLTGEALALAMLVKHPDWPDTKIAKTIGVNRTTLYDWPIFKKAKEALKQGKKEFPKGSKNGETGSMEAWEADT